MDEIEGMRPIVATLMVLFASACGETTDERYPDFKAAQDNGAVQRGWIPTFMPPSAYDIHDVHDLDSNAQSLSFRAPIAYIPTMVADMTPAPATEATTVRRIVEAAGWSESAPGDITTYPLCQHDRPAALTVRAKTGAAFYSAPARWRTNPCAPK